MKFYENWKPFLCFFVHLFLLWAVFDIYYKSPLVHGMTPHGKMPDDVSPASRLVLFVADGLRAHSLYENLSITPFLKNVMFNVGSWGVSHTRVPTESRPGHVALIAGFYEDVSAVTKGWQENPVEFDSVFNESRYTWSWGSPDILPMFAKGASGPHVFTNCYHSSSEDFASSDASKLDTWVFDEVKMFFNQSIFNDTLTAMLRQKKIVFFLHLLGLDTNGHGNKPLSPEYFQNIRIVDEGVASIYELVENYYGNDGRTAYIFTSDHGMTDWGSHGAGDAHETMTPLIAWGAGIPGPNGKADSKNPDFVDIDEKNFGRKDVDQADVAPLMSALLGLNVPMNSVGLLPTNYLNATQRYRASVVCSNFDQLAEQMQTQRKRKYESSVRLLFNDFPDLSPSKLRLINVEVAKLFAQKRFSAAENLCREWSSAAVNGLFYYHQYERRFLTLCVSMTFVFLELCVWRFANEAAAVENTSDVIISPRNMKIFFVLSALTTILFWIYSYPLVRYAYGLVPLFLMAIALSLFRSQMFEFFDLQYPRIALSETKRLLISTLTRNNLLQILAVAVSIELIVWAFFYRWILSIGLWILIAWPQRNSRIGIDLRLSWTINCLLVSIFPFLPTVGKSSNPELIFYACIVLATGFILVYVQQLRSKLKSKLENGESIILDSDFDKELTINILLFIFVTVSGCINLTTWVSIEQKRGSPAINRFLSWLILSTSPCLTLFVRRDLWTRLRTLTLALFCPLTLMSVSYETLFYGCLCSLLYFWLKIEEIREKEKSEFDDETNSNLNRDDVRRAYFFVFFVFLSFFGTGNIASVNSFNPSFTAAFVTVFSPFVMGALLLTKIAIPFFVVCSFLCGLEALTSRSVGVLFWLIVMISDGMALRFFFLLRDQGSWLDIGTSISHFVISSATILIVMILYHLAKMALTKSAFSNQDGGKRHVL